MPQLKDRFESRDDLIAYCRSEFSSAAEVHDAIAPTLGGRAEAERRLAVIDPPAYGRTRNYFDGAVTRLSPYLRHGVVGLAEVRDAAIARAGSPSRAYKLLNELAWRDYWRRVLDQIGDRIWDDLETYKTGYDADDYAPEMPADILAAETGIEFIDASVCELYETGYLHNQARMKLAAYVVHWRRIAWQAGAAWFLTHLLDGDLASNNLSWQWVASTFSHKPYIFNQANLQKWAGDRFAAAPTGENPFAGSYEAIAERLFA